MSQDFAIVFDLDGTLADTAPDLLASLNHSVRDHGFGEFTLAEIGHLVGHGSIAMIRRAFELHDTHLPEELLSELHQEFLVHYEANIAVHSRLFDGAAKLLDHLSQEGFVLAVCTNKYEAMARRLLGELGVLERFAAITGGDTFEFRKPDARHLDGTIERCGTPHGLMIGDTITDADAAKNAGRPLILVDFGYSSRPVGEMGAGRVISHFSQAPQAIGELLAE
ncbi:HAD-IA family hydrolase [Salaquimonas pukyongi]|uniref:HAD-IA family hydrolase n=1 Tax=Salaquimonas pukyongi TaxID=2712698 RepID=UPI00096B8C04|nr:HAD-IA family hydrolase [Salaquimonas pukyongi]